MICRCTYMLREEAGSGEEGWSRMPAWVVIKRGEADGCVDAVDVDFRVGLQEGLECRRTGAA